MARASFASQQLLLVKASSSPVRYALTLAFKTVRLEMQRLRAERHRLHPCRLIYYHFPRNDFPDAIDPN
jgi:hypothetical protein